MKLYVVEKMAQQKKKKRSFTPCVKDERQPTSAFNGHFKWNRVRLMMYCLDTELITYLIQQLLQSYLFSNLGLVSFLPPVNDH